MLTTCLWVTCGPCVAVLATFLTRFAGWADYLDNISRWLACCCQALHGGSVPCLLHGMGPACGLGSAAVRPRIQGMLQQQGSPGGWPVRSVAAAALGLKLEACARWLRLQCIIYSWLSAWVDRGLIVYHCVMSF